MGKPEVNPSFNMQRGSKNLFLDQLEYESLKALYDNTNGKNWFLQFKSTLHYLFVDCNGLTGTGSLMSVKMALFGISLLIPIHVTTVGKEYIAIQSTLAETAACLLLILSLIHI